MGLFDSLFGKDEALPSQVTFTLDQAGHTYEDGSVGLLPTSLTITPDDRRVAVIGLNGAGKTTLLKLLDGALAATSGSVSITAGETALSPAVKRDLKRIEDIVGRVRREEIPDSYYRAATIREAIDQPLKKSATCSRISGSAPWLGSRPARSTASSGTCSPSPAR